MTQKTLKLITTGFNAGLSPVAPGTCGTFVGLLIGYIFISMLNVGLIIWVLICALTTALSIYASNKALETNLFKGKDPQSIVIDEIAGIFITLAPLTVAESSSFIFFLFSFAIFRFFDITKVWPINYFEKLDKGLGITMDDVAAGVISCLICWFIFIPY